MPLPVIDLGRLAYAPAYEQQVAHLDRVLAARAAGAPIEGFLLLVEHEPVITISRRAGAADHLLATPQLLQQSGVALAETDRGGDITYHGPGQLVAYPILDLNLLNLGIHEYMRLLEQSVIEVCGRFGVATQRDPAATGVWTVPSATTPGAKIAALGVRVRRWVSMHGLALNVSTNLDHFRLIVPCGLHGRPVTTLAWELGSSPAMASVKAALVEELSAGVEAAAASAHHKRDQAAGVAP